MGAEDRGQRSGWIRIAVVGCDEALLELDEAARIVGQLEREPVRARLDLARQLVAGQVEPEADDGDQQRVSRDRRGGAGPGAAAVMPFLTITVAYSFVAVAHFVLPAEAREV